MKFKVSKWDPVVALTLGNPPEAFQQKSVESAEHSTFKFDSLIGHSSNPGAWSESEVPVPGFGVRIFFFGHGGSGRGSYAVLWKAETEIQDSFVRSNETGQQRLRFSLIN